VTDQANLERSYRRLLASYPRAFRRDNGQEILAVLMACTPNGRRRPSVGASVDLIKSGLHMRLRPRGPRPTRTVRAAVGLMYAGAAVTTVGLIISIAFVAFVGPRVATLRLAGRNQPLAVAITVGIVLGAVEIVCWLWMARQNSLGRSWARLVSTVLFSLATANLFANKLNAADVFAIPIWLVALGATWLLWRPTSSAFFQTNH
jgi:hypothetical protein